MRAPKTLPLPLVLDVQATAYTRDDGSTGGAYLDGRAPWVGTIAVSHDLRWLLGREVRVNGYTYVARDLMGPEWTGRIDFWMSTLPEAKRWGIRRVLVVVP